MILMENEIFRIGDRLGVGVCLRIHPQEGVQNLFESDAPLVIDIFPLSFSFFSRFGYEHYNLKSSISPFGENSYPQQRYIV